MKYKLPAKFLLFLTILILLNGIQAALTPLIFDEAYYWYFAQNLAWGYFDHPPMVALMIKLGTFINKGEFGVRLVSCILSGATALILWKTIENQEKRNYIPHFFVLLFSMTLLNAYGFLTLPDTPLLFFTALFLLLYKGFLKKPGYFLAVGLGIAMAGLMYSKYHAFLVIFFVGISNLKILRSQFTWLAIAVAVLAYIPHLMWLAEFDFVSIRYHLFDRPNRAYEFADFTLGYLLNLIVLFGLTFPWIYLALFKSTKFKDNFNRALLFLVYGVLIFFLISSFDRRVQTQWIIVICIPVFLIVYSYLIMHPRIRRYLLISGIINGVIILFLRVGLVYEPLFPIVYETHGNKEWVAQISKAADGKPVVFENSYRRAPMYEFYSGNPSFSLNNIMYRRNQYSIDASEKRVRDQSAYYVSAYEIPEGDMFVTLKGDTLYGKHIEYFKPYRKLRIEAVSKQGNQLLFQLNNPYDKDIDLGELTFGIAFLNEYKQVIEVRPLEANTVLLGARRIVKKSALEYKGKLPGDLPGEARYFQISISENGLYWGLNSWTEKLDDGI